MVWSSAQSSKAHSFWNWIQSLWNMFDLLISVSPDDCASILLACLYCRFCDVMAMLPDACEQAFVRCFPSYTYHNTSDEPSKGKDWCGCNVDFDCGFMNSCQEASELIELAMEISEVCYRWESLRCLEIRANHPGWRWLESRCHMGCVSKSLRVTVIIMSKDICDLMQEKPG